MQTRILSGKEVAAGIRARVQEQVDELRRCGITPRLDVVLVGEDPASLAYVATKEKQAAQVGIRSHTHRLPGATTTTELLGLLGELQAEADLDGLLVQLPLPPAIDAAAVVEALDPARDVDGLTPYNLGRLFCGRPALVPCTPAGVMALLDASGEPLAGRDALVLGRSLLMGKPMAQLLLGRDATVTIGHSRSRDLPALVGRADLLVVAVGKPGLVRGEWIREGAVVIDVGINRLADGRLVGDVDYAGALGRAGLLTPVPGGVGPMTTALLLSNTVLAARRRAELPAAPSSRPHSESEVGS
ncbi:MAG: tetrahydrofolate dehydrogenase/cyclohydrolase catalytic domain-containing protein [Myxococcota bacterium]|nr:tetrahydrofolate dehydrogenase/cyclohydrolase catalytic domain-containing protein [Myxococcota bacterium]